MAKDDTRRATPRTSTKTSAGLQGSQRGSQGLKGTSSGKGRGKRVVLAEPDAARARRSQRVSPGQVIGLIGRLAVAAVILAIVAAIALSVLRTLPVFTISSIDTEATEHLSEQDIANLAGVVEGTTLLSVDEEVIEQNLMRNPWVAEVHVHRKFPDKLGIEVRERSVDSLVLMSTSAFAWYIGEGNVWLEPATFDIADGQTAKDAAQALAIEKGATFIVDVPATVNPQAGGEVTDEVLLAIDTYRRELPEAISSQVVYFSASSLEGISCVLTSGVEVSLGNPTQIEQKAAVLTQILDQYPGEITYVNVREPSTPAYRRIDSGTVQPGSGA